ncbi:MAG: hypothetical protein ACYS47_07975, partial [Planctomycetota bacterium]
MAADTIPPRRSRFAFLPLLLASAVLLAPAARAGSPRLKAGKPYRGVAFLSSAVGSDVSQEEIETFCKECRIDFVVIDFAWITFHWERTDKEAVERLAVSLGEKGIVVGAMYRPRALSKGDAEVHFARKEDGSLPES